MTTFSQPELKDDLRQKLLNDTARYLQLGGQVEEVPTTQYQREHRLSEGEAVDNAIKKQVKEKGQK